MLATEPRYGVAPHPGHDNAVRVPLLPDLRRPTMRLKDKVAIVTGAAHGIGLAIARHFVAEGRRVTIAEVNPTAGEAAARALGNARFLAPDGGDAASAAKARAE